MKPRPLWYATANFWRRVRSSRGPHTCWPWTGSAKTDGYGQVTIRALSTIPIRAHRLAWYLSFGNPGKACVLHHCDNRLCCNPAHLFLGTKADNSADMARKGRNRPSFLRGEQHGNAKLTNDGVAEIRKLASLGVPLRALGERFGVTTACIHRVVTRRSWRHLGGVA